MKRILFLLLVLVHSSSISFAQKKAITELGEEVVLFEDGTWKYQSKEQTTEQKIATNDKKFVKNEKSSFLLKSSKFNIGFWIDPKTWTFKKGGKNEDAEYEMHLKDGDLYAMIITEKIEIPLETLKTVAFENGKEAAPDLKIEKEEFRNVNGKTLLFLQMSGTIKGIKFTYYGYYYSNPNGTVQFITYTAQNMLSKYVGECEKLLNGFVELNEK